MLPQYIISLTNKHRILAKLGDSLYLNSIFLILTTGTMAVSGFVFWLINAKLFSASDIGIATAIIPTTIMIAIGSLLGLDNSIVRFLNTVKNKKEFVRSAIFSITLISIIISIIFGVFSFFLSPTISDFLSNTQNNLIFIALSVTTAINLFCDAVYLAHKKTIFTLLVTTTHSFLRTVFPFLFIEYGSVGILLAATLAQALGVIINMFVLQKNWQYFDKFTISLNSFAGIWKYTTHNYIASMLGLLPISIVPIIIVDNLGSADSAYFYIVMMVVNLIYVVAGAATKSLFAEGSHSEENLGHKILKTSSFILIFTLPAILILFFVADFILNFFGEDYSENGSFLLKILSLTAIPLGIISVANAIFKIKHKSQYLLIIAFLQSISEVYLVYYFINLGLNGIGYATIVSSAATAIIASLLVFVSLKTTDK